MATEIAHRTGVVEELQECLQSLGWMAELSPGGGDVYHLWATKGRRMWLVQVPEACSRAVTATHQQQLDREAHQIRATAVVAGTQDNACWFASLRTGRLLEP